MEFAKSFEEASPSTPIFFILSPGVNPLKDVEQLGKQLGYTEDSGNFHNVSLGQGQEVVAEVAMDEGATKGHWVILQVGSYFLRLFSLRENALTPHPFGLCSYANYLGHCRLFS